MFNLHRENILKHLLFHNINEMVLDRIKYIQIFHYFLTPYFLHNVYEMYVFVMLHFIPYTTIVLL